MTDRRIIVRTGLGPRPVLMAPVPELWKETTP